MAETTFDRLYQETAKIEWQALERFFAQGRILVVSKPLDLVKVAAAVADDDKKFVQPLIEQEQLFFANPEWVKKHCQASTLVWSVVVAPYILVQPT